MMSPKAPSSEPSQAESDVTCDISECASAGGCDGSRLCEDCGGESARLSLMLYVVFAVCCKTIQSLSCHHQTNSLICSAVYTRMFTLRKTSSCHVLIWFFLQSKSRWQRPRTLPLFPSLSAKVCNWHLQSSQLGELFFASFPTTVY